TDGRGATRHWTVSPAFARVMVAEKDELPPEVSLICGGQALCIGMALSPSERRELAQALERAIGNARNERYNSPQDRQS
nr:DUF2244 domain-containing protein [Hyphomonadaceae bacterium]